MKSILAVVLAIMFCIPVFAEVDGWGEPPEPEKVKPANDFATPNARNDAAKRQLCS
jgi:hypothetical protein